MTTRPGYIWSGTEWVAIGQEAVETPFLYQATAPTSPSTGDIWVDSDAIVNGLNTNDYLLKADVPTTAVYKMNTGTTAERPTGAAGLFRFNTTTGYPEWYDTSSGFWVNFSDLKPFPIEYLVVAGGGGGGFNGGGGGGAGGYLTNSILLDRGVSHTITVGAGGAGSSNLNRGSNGSNSVFSSVTCIGGGGGGSRDGSQGNGAVGGSGGAGGGNDGGLGAAGTSGQGNTGGNSAGSGTNQVGGGGGGAGAAGTTGTSGSTAGNGGIGAANSITGSSVYYAGGGGGNRTVNGSAGSSGSGSNGQGGLGGGPTAGGASGATGIVIIAYPSSYGTLSTISAGLTYSLSTSSRSGYNVYTFTAGTGSIAV